MFLNYLCSFFPGRGSVRLERLVRDQEVGGSNPLAPTMSFVICVLHSRSVEKYYIGQTINLDRRLKDHNSGLSNYWKVGIPWDLVFTKSFNSRSEAMKYETFLKAKKSKSFIDKLIKSG